MKTIGKVNFGDILLVEYRFSDGSATKLRPVCVLYRLGLDIVVMKMTSKNNPFKDLIGVKQDENNNLRSDGYIEYKKIDTFHEMLFKVKLGSLGEKDRKKVKTDFVNFIAEL